jgi:hypothetical protein
LTEGNAVAAPRSGYPKAISGERQLPFPLEYAVVATVAGNYVKRSVGARYFRRSADCEYSLIFGTGSGNGSVTVPNYSKVGSAFHVVVASYDTVNGIKTIQVYNQPQVVQAGLLGSPRIGGTLPLRIGESIWRFLQRRHCGSSGTNSTATDTIANGTRFYRLHHP